ncbi:hypothetical protein HBH53_043850 [Parastagonospora nodorum]|nr:hypothetical protein HBH53_043850 [Parastagonospora nodorum]KAH5073581.1 hypothetical protein HBH95_155140 [Parastagonospora nodorum]KAH5158060.1 hypothetical protein HBH69_073430 [Parastagonospora nodorum]KAH6461025.1 hypothetical protein HBI59_061150 [Parastagonospora nodorum]
MCSCNHVCMQVEFDVPRCRCRTVVHLIIAAHGLLVRKGMILSCRLWDVCAVPAIYLPPIFMRVFLAWLKCAPCGINNIVRDEKEDRTEKPRSMLPM